MIPKRFALFVLTLCMACTCTTSPAPPTTFAPGCRMTQAGVDRLPDGSLADVWQDWTCSNGMSWHVNKDGVIARKAD